MADKKKKKTSAAEKKIKELEAELKQLKKDAKAQGKYKYKDTYGLQKEYNKAHSNVETLTDENKRRDYGFDAYRTGGKYANIANVDDLFNQVMSQEKFSYDMEKDQLFQMYKKQYNAQATKAMRNAMGVGAAFSGGYNSSAAQTASQTQYLNHMDALNQKAAETYQNALSRYDKKQQDLMNRYNMAMDMNNASNEAYWNRVNTALTRESNALNNWNSDDDRQYRSWNDTRTFNQQAQQNTQTQLNWWRDYDLNRRKYNGK